MPALVKTFHDSVPQYKITRGTGLYLETECGRRFLDFTSGITAHSILGYSQQRIIDRIKMQAELICHADYKVFRDDVREELAELLCR